MWKIIERIWRAGEVVCFTDRIEQSDEVPIKSILHTFVYRFDTGVVSHVRTDTDAAGLFLEREDVGRCGRGAGK